MTDESTAHGAPELVEDPSQVAPEPPFGTHADDAAPDDTAAAHTGTGIGTGTGTGTATPDRLPDTVVARASAPFDDGVVRALANGAAPGAVIEQAANAVRLLCPDRGVAVWYRRPDGTANVQAAGVSPNLVMITGDPDSPFWQRARTEEQPNYKITFKAHPDDLGPTSVWCVPLNEGPASGEITMVVVGSDDGTPPGDDVRIGLEHVARLIGVSIDRTSLVTRLEQAQDRPDGPSPEVTMGLAPTRGDAEEPEGTVLFYVKLAQVKDFEHLHGLSAGEDLIREIGKRLSTTIRPGDTVARLSNTDFVLRCYGVTAIQAESIIARLLNNLWDPVVTRWEETRLRPRIGIARATEPTQLAQLTKEADAAMVTADRAGRDWLWAGQEVEIKPAELGPAPAPSGSGFGAGRAES